ncbi:MAG TPA: hypothetical protein VHK05_03700 [Candidatus Limnocylindrales bacterium]|nr:hypothetical protein [Candidatus Limnocylindrales bacterium]
MRSDHLHGLVRSTDGVLQLLADGASAFDDRPTDQLHAVFAERLHAAPREGLTFGSAVTRLLVLNELRKSGALSYDEFNGLKTRLLGL